MVSLHCTLPCELRSGDFLEPGKPADLWECSLGFSKNSEVFLVGKTTLSINSCVHYLTRVNRHLKCFPLELGEGNVQLINNEMQSSNIGISQEPNEL